MNGITHLPDVYELVGHSPKARGRHLDAKGWVTRAEARGLGGRGDGH